MDVVVIIPALESEAVPLAATLEGVRALRYDGGRIVVCVAQYGGGASLATSLALGNAVRLVAVDGPSPYSARNMGVQETSGEVLCFTEPGCIPDRNWVQAHVAAMRGTGVTVSVGHVGGARETWALSTFSAYEHVRDRWVFAGTSWQHMFGRPKNMAVARHRFASHGPFVEVMRGADSKLVQLVAREVSVREIALTPAAIVRQLSVRGLPSGLRERYAHGQALRVHRSAHAAPIPLAQRVELFRQTIAERGFGGARSAAMFALLAAGIAAFRLGGASARFVRRP